MREWESQGVRGSERVERRTMYHHQVRRRGGRNAADAEQKRSALSAMLFAGITVSNLSLSSWSFLAAGISRCRLLRPAPNSRRGYARHSRDIVAQREYTGCSVIGGARWARGVSRFMEITFSLTREKERGEGEGGREGGKRCPGRDRLRNPYASTL